MKKTLTLAIIIEEDRVLLGMKKRGFGAGMWNGFGGKVEAGETIEEAAVREIEEEVGLTPTIMEKVGLLTFTFETADSPLEVHVFKVTAYQGKPIETEEMRPQWFPFNAVPFESMWADDELWFPYLKQDVYFKGHFLFDRPATTDFNAVIRTYTLETVESLL